MQIPVREVEKRMIIDDGTNDAVLVTEVWDQGKGLGVVIKGQHVDDGTQYFRRFLNPDLVIDVTARNV